MKNFEVLQLQEVVVKRVANCLGISTNDKTITEIYNDISGTDNMLFDLMDNFIRAYRLYNNYHEWLASEDKHKNMSAEEQHELQKRTFNKEETKRLLIEALTQRGC